MVASPVSIFVRIFCVLSAGLEHPLVIPYRDIAVNKGTSLHTHLIRNDMAFMLVYRPILAKVKYLFPVFINLLK